MESEGGETGVGSFEPIKQLSCYWKPWYLDFKK